MANEVAKTGGGGAVVKSDKTIAGMLAKPETAWGRELLKVLPGKKEVARFMACALNQLADPKVGAKLAACSVPSFFNCIMKSARSGIMPDGVNAYLIPYGKECQLQFSYRGLCDMAIREGIASHFKADIVRRNDYFLWESGELVKHTPAGWDDEERGDIVGAWVGAHLQNGEWVYERMSFKEIEDVRRCSQNPNGVWAKWWGEMAKKSVLKRLFKKMRNTPAMSEAIGADNETYDLEGKKGGKAAQAIDFGDEPDAEDIPAKASEATVDVDPSEVKEDAK